MTTLTEFLLARIAEDEECASRVSMQEVGGESSDPVVRWRGIRSRVLAECEAKRLLLEFASVDDWTDPNYAGYINAPGADRSDVLVALTLPYADHPDYDETWRP